MAAVGKETGPIPGHNETSPDARAASDDPRVPEDGCGSFGSGTAGPGSGSCLCRGTHGIGKPPAGLYGVPGLSVPAFPYRSNGMVSP